ncbi:MAG: hypothetical protein RMK32_10400, partial [Anaerolineae bacterium]|nr:hypothetical protein [Anaerolineae bacterium]
RKIRSIMPRPADIPDARPIAPPPLLMSVMPHKGVDQPWIQGALEAGKEGSNSGFIMSSSRGSVYERLGIQ